MVVDGARGFPPAFVVGADPIIRAAALQAHGRFGARRERPLAQGTSWRRPGLCDELIGAGSHFAGPSPMTKFGERGHLTTRVEGRAFGAARDSIRRWARGN